MISFLIVSVKLGKLGMSSYVPPIGAHTEGVLSFESRIRD